MRFVVALVLIGGPALHALHVLTLLENQVPLVSAGRPLSWSSLDRIAASGPLGRSAVLGIDALLVAGGIKLLIGRSSRPGRKDRQEKSRSE